MQQVAVAGRMPSECMCCLSPDREKYTSPCTSGPSTGHGLGWDGQNDKKNNKWFQPKQASKLSLIVFVANLLFLHMTRSSRPCVPRVCAVASGAKRGDLWYSSFLLRHFVSCLLSSWLQSAIVFLRTYIKPLQLSHSENNSV